MMSEEIVNSVRFLINMLKVIEIFVIMFLAALNTIIISKILYRYSLLLL